MLAIKNETPRKYTHEQAVEILMYEIAKGEQCKEHRPFEEFLTEIGYKSNACRHQ